MDYKLTKREFTAPNGAKRVFWYRENTSDYNTIVAAFCEDEYKILGLDFEPGDNVIDLGAHIGAVFLLFSTIRSDINLIAYEPIRDNFELLMKNYHENEIDNPVSFFQQAVWFYEEDVVKIYYGDNSKVGKVQKFVGTQFPLYPHYDKRVFIKAQAVSLEKVFEDNRIHDCAFMKMDCEGAEYGIFKGASAECLKTIKRIHGEWHSIDHEGMKTPRKSLFDQTKGVFKDETNQPDGGLQGPFVFIRK